MEVDKKDKPLTLPSIKNDHANKLHTVRENSLNSNETTRQACLSGIRRKMDYSIGYNGRPHQEDLAELSKEIMNSMANILQPYDKKQAWIYLNQLLEAITPYQVYISDSMFYQYIERVVYRYQVRKKLLSDVPILVSLRSVFPESTASAEMKYKKDMSAKDMSGSSHTASSKQDKPSQSTKTAQKGIQRQSLNLPNGANPYQLKRPDGDPLIYFGNKPLTMNHLQQVVGNVAHETRVVDTVNKCSTYSSAALAMSVQLPMRKEQVAESESFDDTMPDFWKEAHERPTDKTEKTSKKVPAVDYLSLNGFEAVELFLKHRHMGKTRFIFLNHASLQKYRPYHLVSVRREEVYPEHFVFSSFGVVHVKPGEGDSESLTLAEWHRHASLWKVVNKIPFFAHFLLKRTIRRWKANTRCSVFRKSRNIIGKQIVNAIPVFRNAMIQLFSLTNELSTIKFLPVRKRETKVYNIGAFKKDSNFAELESSRYIRSFFRCCNKIIEVAQQSCHKQLLHCQLQVNMSNSSTGESLYLQRLKREHREKKLKEAQETYCRLTSFFSLINTIISCSLIGIARDAVNDFVYGFLSNTIPEVTVAPENEDTHSEQEEKPELKDEQTTDSNAFPESSFFAEIRFNNSTHKLAMQPSITEFRANVSQAVDVLIRYLCGRDPMEAQDSGTSSNMQDMLASGGDSGVPDLVQSSCSTSHPPTIDGVDPLPSHENFAPIEVADKEDEIIEAYDLCRGIAIEAADANIPSKSRDDMGVATPTALNLDGRLDLKVEGRGIMLENQPKDRDKLWNMMRTDSLIVSTLAERDRILNDMVATVTHFCTETNSWMKEVRKFTTKWAETKKRNTKNRNLSKPADEMEILVMTVKEWNERVANFQPYVVSKDNILLGHCPQIHTELLPELKEIQEELKEAVSARASELIKEALEEMNQVIAKLSNKPTGVSLFAFFAKQFNTSSKRKGELLEQIEQIRGYLNTIVKAYRPLTSLEVKQLALVESVWKAFLQKLAEGEEFIKVQKPIVLEEMDAQFERGEKKAKEIVNNRIGLSLDPESEPKAVLEQLDECAEELYVLVLELRELNEIKKAIFGERYNLIPVEDASNRVGARRRLWQIIAFSKSVIKDWRSTLIKKFDPEGAIEKLFEWQKVAEELAQALPPQDIVLAHWCKLIEDVLLDLPPLCQISSNAMHIRHWNAIFTELGIADDEDRELTVDELLKCDLFKSSKPINTIYKSACSEYTLEKKMNTLKKSWEERRYQLAKHIYVVRTPNDNAEVGQDEFIEEEIDSKTYVLVEEEQILDQIADSHIFLHFMLHSSGSDLRPVAKVWSDTLHQINEIILLWQSCQNKWVYLNRVFNSDPYLASRLTAFRDQFNVIDALYRKFTASVIHDPKVLSVLSRLFGQKGWRELQGEQLRKHLQHCVLLEERILQEIADVLDEFRTNFPRLFFLSDDSCIRLLGLARHPRALIPYVRECFPAVASVEFGMPASSTNRQSMNLNINAHMLVATDFVGNFGETLHIEPVRPNSDVAMWLKELEANMRSSLEKLLKDAIVENMQHHKHTHGLLEEVYEVKDEDFEDTDFDHWLIRYPSQVVLFCKDVLFYRNLKKLLSRGAKTREYELVNKQLLHSLHYLSQIQQELIAMNSAKMFVKRVANLLSSVIIQTCYHRDVLLRISGLVQHSLSSYEWQSLIKPSAEIVDYQPLKLKSLPPDEDGTAEHPEYGSDQISKSISVEKCYIEHMGECDDYGYEYQTLHQSSNPNSTFCSGVVITPMTERCLFGTIVSLRAGLCVGINGVPGVGKTVTTRELARIYGRPFFDFDCSKDSSLNILNKCLIGTVETGSLFCFSRAELLPLQTLSALAQNINSILHSYKLIRARPKTAHMTRGHIGNDKPKRSPSLLALRSCNVADMELQLSDVKDGIQPGFHTDDGCAADFVDRAQYHDTVKEGCILFNGDLIPVKDGFGFIFNFTTEHGCLPKLPDNMRCTLRPVCLLQPNLEKLVEVWMYAGGFTDVVRLSRKLALAFTSMLTNASMFEYIDISRQPGKEFPTMRSVVRIASRLLARSRRDREKWDDHSTAAGRPVDPKRHASVTSLSSASVSSGASRTSSKRSENVLLSHLEEQALADATLVCFTPKFGSGEPIIRITETIRSVFSTVPSLTLIRNQYKTLERAIQDQLTVDGRTSSPKWVDKACQLFSLLDTSQSVIITGQSGSGKTTLYSTLSKAFNSLSLYELTEKALEKQNQGQNRSSQFATSMMKITSTGKWSAKEDFVKKLATSTATKNNVSKVTMNALTENFDVSQEDPNELKILRSTDSNINVDISVIFPNAHTVEELYGSYRGPGNRWKSGILSRFLQSAEVRRDTGKKRPVVSALQPTIQPAATKKSQINNLQRWIVLDGEVSQHWIDRIICSLHGHASFKLDNMGKLEFPSSSNIIFETSTITAASPAIIAQCAVLHVDTPHTWKLICDGWIESAHAKFLVDRSVIRTLGDMLYDLVPLLLDFLSGLTRSDGFLQHEEKFNQTSPGVHEINSFISIFTACMAKINLVRKEEKKEEKPPEEPKEKDGASKKKSKMSMLKPLPSRAPQPKPSETDQPPVAPDTRALSTHLLLFSLVWAFGGSLDRHQQQQFDVFIRKEVSNLRFVKLKVPREDSVFDYYFDDQSTEFRKWKETKLNESQPRSCVIPGQTERYVKMSQLLLNYNKSVLLLGVPGCGKSTLVNKLLAPVLQLNKLHFSPLLTPAQIQHVVESKASPTLQRHNLTLMAHPNTILAEIEKERKSSLFFVEDLSYNGEISGEKLVTNAPNLEFVRQLITTNGIHDYERLIYKSLERDLVFLATATTPGAAGSGSGFARQSLSPRLLRHFVILRMQELTSMDMVRIYHEPVNSWLDEFPTISMIRNAEIGEAIIEATFEVYQRAVQVLRVSPRKPHYLFTLHTVGHILKGMFMMVPDMDVLSVGLHDRKNQMKRAARLSIQMKRRFSKGGAKDMLKASPLTRSIVRLWLHECTRTFYDRIIDEHDQLLFKKLLDQQLVKHFCTGVDGDLYQPKLQHLQSYVRPSTGVDVASTEYSPEEDGSGEVGQGTSRGKESPDEGRTTDSTSDDGGSNFLDPSTTIDMIDITNYTDEERTVPQLSFGPAGGSVEKPSDNSPIALIPRDQVLDPDEAVTDVLMTYNIVKRKDHLVGMKYVESSEEELQKQFAQIIIDKKIGCYNPTKVASKYVLHHLSRVSRLLASRDANHAILMSSHRFLGRRNIVRLLAQLNGITLVETKSDLSSKDDLTNQLRCFMKQAHCASGLEDRKVFLLITTEFTQSQDCLNDIASLIEQGSYPELYTPDELAELVSHNRRKFYKDMSAMGVGKQNLSLPLAKSKIEEYVNMFFKRVKSRLCVILLMDCPAWKDVEELSVVEESTGVYHNDQNHQQALAFSRRLRNTPHLLTARLFIDYYAPWPHCYWKQIAEKVLKDKIQELTGGRASHRHGPLLGSKVAKLDFTLLLDELENLTHAMAHIHMDVISRTKLVLDDPTDVIGPPAFFHMIDLLMGIARRIYVKEKQTIMRFGKVSKKIRQLKGDIKDFEEEKSYLIPQHQASLDAEEYWKKRLEDEMQEYTNGKQLCTAEKKRMTDLERSVIQGRKMSVKAMEEVTPALKEAVKTLRCLQYSDLLEIKGYQTPPVGTVRLAEILCKMFKEEPVGWEKGHTLILRENFFNDLEFYDKDNIPDEIFFALRRYSIRSDFKPRFVEQGSKAAGGMCRWVHAIFQYSKSKRYLKPRVDHLKAKEIELHRSQLVYGERRVKFNQLKNSVETQHQSYRTAVFERKKLDDKMKLLQQKMKKAIGVQDHMRLHTDDWLYSCNEAEQNCYTCFGDALIAAACCTYHGSINDQHRKLSLRRWVAVCENGHYNKSRDCVEIQGERAATPMMSHYDEDHNRRTKAIRRSATSDQTLEQFLRTKTVSHKAFLETRVDFSLPDILSDDIEQGGWLCETLTVDYKSRFDALRIAASSIYQQRLCTMLFDPDDRAQLWMKLIFRKIASETVNEDLKTKLPRKPSLKQDSVATKLFPKKKIKFAPLALRSKSAYCQLGRSPSWTDVVSIEKTTTRNFRPRSVSDGSCSVVPTNFIKPIQSTTDLWVYDISHPDIFYILMSAKKHGVCLLIEKAEKRPDYARRIISGCYRKRSSSIGGVSSITHPSFRLFISTSYDLELTTREERKSFPLHMTTITNLTLSFSALQQRLNSQMLAIRWPGFEPHRQLLDKDKMHLMNRIAELKDTLLTRVSDKDEFSLLEDVELSRVVTQCTEKLHEIEDKLTETRELGQSLEKRKLELVEIARYGRILFRAIRISTPILPSLKGITPQVFISLYCNCIRIYFEERSSSDLNNASSESAAGALIVQAQKRELFQALTKMLVKKIEQMTGDVDGRICSFLLVLCTQIDRKQISQNDVNDLLAVVEGKDYEDSQYYFSAISKDYIYSAEHHPKWMSKSEWMRLLHLESNRQAFTGISTSISKRPKEWKEYFDCERPFLSCVPEQFLRDKLKRKDIAIVWSVVRPTVFCRVMQDYCEAEVGFTDVGPHSDNLTAVLPLMSPTVPCVIVANDDDGWDQIPSLQLSFLAIKHNAQLVERTLPFEDDILEVVRDCAAMGQWLYISQYSDEVNEWPEELVLLLHDIVNREGETGAGEKKHGKYDEEKSEETSKKQQTNGEDDDDEGRYDELTQVTRRSFHCHRDFRLWVSIRTEQHSGSLPLPFVLWRYSVFCTLRSNDSLLEKVKRSFNNLMQCHHKVALLAKSSVPARTTDKLLSRDVYRTMKRINVFLPLLHGALSQRCMHVEGGFHGNYVWNDSDMMAIVESLNSSHAASLSYENARGFIIDLMSMTMVDREDMELMYAISSKCFLTSKQIDNASQTASTIEGTSLAHLTKEAYKIAAISENMTSVDTDIYRQIVPKPGSVFFGLHPGAPAPTFAKSSKRMRARLRSCYERQMLKNGFGQIRGHNQTVLAEGALDHVSESITQLQRQLVRATIPSERNDIGHPIMSRYFSDEVKRLRSIISLLKHDFDVVSSAINSSIEITPVIYDMIEDIFRNRLCRVWLQQHRDTFHFHSDLNLATFVTFIPMRAKLITKYIESFRLQFYFDSKPKESASKKKKAPLSQINLSVLTRPDLLFASLTSLTARLEYGDPYKYHVQFELDKRENEVVKRELSDWNKIYLTGFYLMNATWHGETFKVRKTQNISSEVLPRVIVSVVKKNRRYIESQPAKGEEMFDCPVWIHSLTEEKDETVHVMPRNVIFNLPLEGERPNEIWRGSGVSITCLLGAVSQEKMMETSS